MQIKSPLYQHFKCDCTQDLHNKCQSVICVFIILYFIFLCSCCGRRRWRCWCAGVLSSTWALCRKPLSTKDTTRPTAPYGETLALPVYRNWPTLLSRKSIWHARSPLAQQVRPARLSLLLSHVMNDASVRAVTGITHENKHHHLHHHHLHHVGAAPLCLFLLSLTAVCFFSLWWLIKVCGVFELPACEARIW